MLGRAALLAIAAIAAVVVSCDVGEPPKFLTADEIRQSVDPVLERAREAMASVRSYRMASDIRGAEPDDYQEAEGAWQAPDRYSLSFDRSDTVVIGQRVFQRARDASRWTEAPAPGPAPLAPLLAPPPALLDAPPGYRLAGLNHVEIHNLRSGGPGDEGNNVPVYRVAYLREGPPPSPDSGPGVHVLFIRKEDSLLARVSTQAAVRDRARAIHLDYFDFNTSVTIEQPLP